MAKWNQKTTGKFLLDIYRILNEFACQCAIYINGIHALSQHQSTNYSSHVRIIYKIHNFPEHLRKWYDVFFCLLFCFFALSVSEWVNMSCVRWNSYPYNKWNVEKSDRNCFSVPVCFYIRITNETKGVVSDRVTQCQAVKQIQIGTLSCFVLSWHLRSIGFRFISIKSFNAYNCVVWSFKPYLQCAKQIQIVSTFVCFCIWNWKLLLNLRILFLCIWLRHN